MGKNTKRAKVLYLDDYIDDVVEENEEFLPQEFHLRKEDSKIVKGIIDRLPEQQRRVVVFHYFEGMGVGETAKLMDIRQQSVSQYLKLARVKIREDLLSLAERQGNARFRSIALSPVGLVLGQALHMESGSLGLGNEAWAQKLVDGCARHIQTPAAPPEAATSSLKKGLFFGGGGAAVVAVVAALLWTGAPEPASPAPPAELSAEATGSVVLTGGDAENPHVNPTKAVAKGEGGSGGIKAGYWWITPADSETVLYSGQGGVVEEPLAGMQARGEDGEYLLSFKMKDAADHTYTLKCNILILTSG
jgi:predicted DNA-binding protein (UPF0251 family)